MAGIEIVENQKTKEPAIDLGNRLSAKMIELGLSANLATMTTFGGVFRIAPPINISDENLELGLKIMEEAFQRTKGSLPLYGSEESI
jgi:4-aminobutyrate aminotransferase-like enzyme